MRTYHVRAEGLVNAPTGRVYDLIADYRHGHPRIMPRPPFVSLDVEEGGIGAGTVIRCRMRAFGRIRTFRAAITEPEPGRVLCETDMETGTVTSFTVEQIDSRTRVTIATEFESREGLLGRIERFLVARWLPAVYLREIEQMGAVADGGLR